MSVLIHCWGDFACFTRPELKTERYSYDVITPSAARGIFEAIFWHNGITWNIEDIWVRKPVKFINIRRNEVKCLMDSSAVIKSVNESSVMPVCDTNEQRTQRAATILKNVDYYIRAWADVNEKVYYGTKQKADGIIMKRMERGASYMNPYFGCREFPVNYELVHEVPACPPELCGEIDLGNMLYDLDYRKKQPEPYFYHPVMRDGHIRVPGREEVFG